VPLGRLRGRLGELPHERGVVTHCTSGYRSAIASSLLLCEGRSDVADLAGGLGAWAALGGTATA
jgi:hydroxyacylglutathione hydrolase